MSERMRDQALPARPPAPGDLVHVRSRRWLVEEIVAPVTPGQSSLARLACADDDAQGQMLDVFWDYELDRRILEEEGWEELARDEARFDRLAEACVVRDKQTDSRLAERLAQRLTGARV